MKKRKPPSDKPDVPNGAQNRNPVHDGSLRPEDANGNGTPPPGHIPAEGESPFEFHTVAQRAFLMAFIETGQIKTAITAAGVGYWSHQSWHRSYPGYRTSFKLAKRIAAERIESEAVRRATEGTVRMKFHEGRPIMVPLLDNEGRPQYLKSGEQMMVPYVEHHYSDTLMLALLKANYPKKYRERNDVKMELDAKHRVAGLPPEKAREKLITALQSLANANGGKLPIGNGNGHE